MKKASFSIVFLSMKQLVSGVCHGAAHSKRHSPAKHCPALGNQFLRPFSIMRTMTELI